LDGKAIRNVALAGWGMVPRVYRYRSSRQDDVGLRQYLGDTILITPRLLGR